MHAWSSRPTHRTASAGLPDWPPGLISFGHWLVPGADLIHSFSQPAARSATQPARSLALSASHTCLELQADATHSPPPASPHTWRRCTSRTQSAGLPHWSRGCTHSPIHPSIHPSVRPSVHPSIRPSTNPSRAGAWSSRPIHRTPHALTRPASLTDPGAAFTHSLTHPLSIHPSIHPAIQPSTNPSRAGAWSSRPIHRTPSLAQLP